MCFHSFFSATRKVSVSLFEAFDGDPSYLNLRELYNTLVDPASRSKTPDNILKSITLVDSYTDHNITVLYVKEKNSSFLNMAMFAHFSRLPKQLVVFCQSVISVELLHIITIFELCTVLFHVLLIAQLSFYTSARLTNESWSALGYILEAYFLLEMVVRLVALGEKKYFRNTIFVVQFVLNICSLGSLLALGRGYSNSSPSLSYLLTVLFQSMRLVLMLWIERGQDRLRHLMITTARALFLISSVIYVFAIIAQDVFCGVLTSDSGQYLFSVHTEG
jgi:hypothetical protein